MIFATVGTQLPFDRLIMLLDKYASCSQVPIVAQIGNSKYIPVNIEWRRFYDPDDLNLNIAISKVVISHAGMGTIISCIRLKKPIVVFPRISSLNEHRNDHQLDTVEAFKNYPGIYAAYDEKSLFYTLDLCYKLEPPLGLDSDERKKLCQFLNEFISNH